MARARTDTAEMTEDLMQALEIVRQTRTGFENPEVVDAWATIETFCAIALRVFAKTNPSKIRSEAVTVEIAARFAPTK